MRSFFTLLAIASLSLTATACMRHGSAGDACQAPSLQDPVGLGACADGFVCAPNASGANGNGQSPHWDTASCRETCSSNADCHEAHTSCVTISGDEPHMACIPD